MEEMKQKTAEALKSIKINELKTVLSSGKNIAIDISTSSGEYFEGEV